MTMWKVQVEELIRTFSDYIVNTDSKDEAIIAVKNQSTLQILDKPKAIEEDVQIRRIISVKEVKES